MAKQQALDLSKRENPNDLSVAFCEEIVRRMAKDALENSLPGSAVKEG